MLRHMNIYIECEISDLLLLVPLSKSQHSEITSEAKLKFIITFVPKNVSFYVIVKV